MSKTLLNIPHPELRRPKFAGQLPQNLINIGLTGGIGSGKSTVAQLLRERGAAVIDLDRISHALTHTDYRGFRCVGGDGFWRIESCKYARMGV